MITATRDAFNYFAYGSNMFTRRLRAPDRAPSAIPIATGYIEGRRLTFDKIGLDGTGKCDAEATGRPGDRVYGVLFRIAEADRRALDAVEGLGVGYCSQRVFVVVGNRRVEAALYVALRKNPDLLPFDWYRAMAVAGAEEHGLPDDYVCRLRSQKCVPTLERTAGDERRAASAGGRGCPRNK